MLAQYIAKRALGELERLGKHQLRAIEVKVEEAIGQPALYREELAA